MAVAVLAGAPVGNYLVDAAVKSDKSRTREPGDRLNACAWPEGHLDTQVCFFWLGRRCPRRGD